MITVAATAQESEMAIDFRPVKESFSAIQSVAEEATSYFCGRLFAEFPQLRALFPAAMDVPRDRLFRGLTHAVASLDSPDDFRSFLEGLGCHHLKYGIRAEHYEPIGRALIATVRRFAGETWSAEAETAWRAGYQVAAAIMIAAAERESRRRPPWWTAEVTAHDRRTPDLAVLTVRPHQRLPYQPGQYVSVETSRWPRVWRRYSVANAPRDDGSIDLHVRAVPAGWVSGALVHHTQVGHEIRLGPAMGVMLPDNGSARDALCVAGGTGLAPIKAIVERFLRERHGRQIHLFFGARGEEDLYDLAALRRLETRHSQLRVVPVVSHEPSYAGMQGMLPDVVARDRSWADHDVFVSGPDQMIWATVARLQEVGVPLARIRHDADGTVEGTVEGTVKGTAEVGDGKGEPTPVVGTRETAEEPHPALRPAQSAHSAEVLQRHGGRAQRAVAGRPDRRIQGRHHFQRDRLVRGQTFGTRTQDQQGAQHDRTRARRTKFGQCRPDGGPRVDHVVDDDDPSSGERGSPGEPVLG